jgi:uncharacterized membrane protein YkoI
VPRKRHAGRLGGVSRSALLVACAAGYSQAVQRTPPMRHAMKMLSALLLPLLLVAPLASAAPAQQRDQQQAWRQRQQGRILPLREIEARVLPTMRGSQYLGFDFEGDSGIYTLKFLRDGVVIWVDVDGRSGQIIGRTGH